MAPWNNLFAAFAVAAFGIGAPVALADTAAPMPKTAAALHCLAEFRGPDCIPLFNGGAARLYDRGPLGRNPEFRAARYAGSNRNGDDIWDVTFLNGEATYVIAVPDAAGKIRSYSVMQGPPAAPCVDTVGTLKYGGFAFNSCRVIVNSD